MHFDHIYLSLLLPDSLSCLSKFIASIFNPLCVENAIHMCMDVGPSTGIYTTYQELHPKGNECSPSGSCLLSIAPLLVVEIHEPLLYSS